MNNLPSTSGKWISTLQIVFIAILLGMLFTIVTIFIVMSFIPLNFTDTEIDPLIPSLILFLFIFTSLFGAEYIFRKKIAQAKQYTTMQKKASSYTVALILRLALFEAPAMASIFAALFLGVIWYVAIAAIFPLLMLVYFPSKERIISQLELEGEEAELIRNPSSNVGKN